MINFDLLDKDLHLFKDEFKSRVVESVVIDNFLDEESAFSVYSDFPDPVVSNIKKSRDYFFAKNKYERSDFGQCGESLSKLRNELLGTRFKEFLISLTGEDVFIDPNFHGGGIHQGGKNSFLNMHADFNYHPLNNNWFRNLNILIYFNPEWQECYGGELKIINSKTGAQDKISPIFNRCVIMFTRDYTLHGYDKINFPEGTYRRSIAAYAYSLVDSNRDSVRSTVWYPDDGGIFKKALGKNWPKLVAAKSRFFSSGTGKNK